MLDLGVGGRGSRRAGTIGIIVHDRASVGFAARQEPRPPSPARPQVLPSRGTSLDGPSFLPCSLSFLRSSAFIRDHPCSSVALSSLWLSFLEPIMTAEQLRLDEARALQAPWKKWGPYLSERQWGTVREDYSE